MCPGGREELLKRLSWNVTLQGFYFSKSLWLLLDNRSISEASCRSHLREGVNDQKEDQNTPGVCTRAPQVETEMRGCMH